MAGGVLEKKVSPGEITSGCRQVGKPSYTEGKSHSENKESSKRKGKGKERKVVRNRLSDARP